MCRFQDGFKQMWINNGNTLSKLYAGTAALCSVRKKLPYGIQALQMIFTSICSCHVNVNVAGRV